MKRSVPARIPGSLTILVFCIACFTAASGEIVQELSLENAGSLGTSIAIDSSVKADESGSVRIETLWPTTICLGEVADLEIDEAKLVYQAKVKSNLSEGTAYLEMWCHVGGGKYFSRGKDSVVSGSTDWKLLETPFFLQKGQKAEKVTLNVVIEGIGTIWVDSASLVRHSLK